MEKMGSTITKVCSGNNKQTDQANPACQKGKARVKYFLAQLSVLQPDRQRVQPVFAL
jgi:hypothetical protein